VPISAWIFFANPLPSKMRAEDTSISEGTYSLKSSQTQTVYRDWQLEDRAESFSQLPQSKSRFHINIFVEEVGGNGWET
jgi:hypothetical protein